MKNSNATAMILGSALLAVGLAIQPTSSFAQEPVKAQEPAKVAVTAEKKKESAALKAIAASKALYVGAAKCKSCHNKESQGGINDKWEEMGHSKAFTQLASPESLKLGKELEIKKPQEAADCLKCHVTAYGLPKEKLHKRFKPEFGVQCETCHGPGSDHVKTRLTEAKENKVESGTLREIPVGEMVLPDELLCLSCHNEDSPSYKEFKYGKNLETIRHLHPKREKPRVLPPKKVVKKDSTELAKKDG